MYDLITRYYAYFDNVALVGEGIDQPSGTRVHSEGCPAPNLFHSAVVYSILAR